MTLSNQSIVVFAGDDCTITYIHNKSDRSGVQDITGYTGFTMYIKQFSAMPDANAALTVPGVITGPATNGQVTFTLRSADTRLLQGDFVFAVRYIDNTGQHKTGAIGTYSGGVS